MTTAATFDELRSACATHNRAGRHEEALAAAEEAWQRFPARRDFTWYLVAYTNMALGRPSDAMAAIETAEAEGRVWRASLLRIRELDPLREEPRFIALLDRLRARIAARGYQPGLLVAQPEPPDPGAPLLLGLHGATSTAEEYHGHWLPAVGLGCIVASAQSTQPAADHAFCWDDRDQVRRDLAAVLPDLPPHGGVVLTGFSQGAAIAVELAVAGDVVPARGPEWPSCSGRNVSWWWTRCRRRSRARSGRPSRASASVCDRRPRGAHRRPHERTPHPGGHLRLLAGRQQPFRDRPGRRAEADGGSSRAPADGGREPPIPAAGGSLPGRRGRHLAVPRHRRWPAHAGQRARDRPGRQPGRAGRLRRPRRDGRLSRACAHDRPQRGRDQRRRACAAGDPRPSGHPRPDRLHPAAGGAHGRPAARRPGACGRRPPRRGDQRDQRRPRRLRTASERRVHGVHAGRHAAHQGRHHTTVRRVRPDPGRVQVPFWRPDGPPPVDADKLWILGAVGRKPGVTGG